MSRIPPDAPNTPLPRPGPLSPEDFAQHITSKLNRDGTVSFTGPKWKTDVIDETHPFVDTRRLARCAAYAMQAMLRDIPVPISSRLLLSLLERTNATITTDGDQRCLTYATISATSTGGDPELVNAWLTAAFEYGCGATDHGDA